MCAYSCVCISLRGWARATECVGGQPWVWVPTFHLACLGQGLLFFWHAASRDSSVYISCLALGMLWLQIYAWGSSCILGIQAQVLTLPQWIIYSLSWILSPDPWSFDGRTLYQLYQYHRVKQSPGWCFWCSSGREWNLSHEGGGRCLRVWHLVYPLDPESFCAYWCGLTSSGWTLTLYNIGLIMVPVLGSCRNLIIHQKSLIRDLHVTTTCCILTGVA